jgi:hypothetical protein
VLPVNFLLAAQEIVFGTGPGDKHAAVRAGRPLTFEADDIERATRTDGASWSPARPTSSRIPVRSAGSSSSVSTPGAPAPGRSFVRMRIQEITGRLLPLRPGRVTVERVG